MAALAWIRVRQKSLAEPGLMSVLAVASIPPAKPPMIGDHGGLLRPEGGVAEATAP
jgi:hypothetical protein